MEKSLNLCPTKQSTYTLYHLNYMFQTIERKEFVESRNQRNLQSNLNDQRKKQNVETDLLGGSDVEIEDPFFDDPVPHSSGLKGLGT